jgi:site-specific recombinase XerD
VHQHCLSATYATRLLRSGVDLKSVQKLLGHSFTGIDCAISKTESKKPRLKINAVKFGA